MPFAIADSAPDLADDAPGSATVRLGTVREGPSPLESWARLLFGEPGGGRRGLTPGPPGRRSSFPHPIRGPMLAARARVCQRRAERAPLGAERGGWAGLG